jgi:hypothetical protein
LKFIIAIRRGHSFITPQEVTVATSESFDFSKDPQSLPDNFLGKMAKIEFSLPSLIPALYKESA